jgi:hypothetical protein
LLLHALIKVAQSGLCQYEVSLVRVVLDRSAKNNYTRLQAKDVRPFHEATLVLVLVKKIVPQVMF